MSSRTGLLVALATAAAGCVHHVETATAEKPPAPPLTKPDRTIYFEPVIIKGAPEQVAISSLNDAELYAIGQAAMGGGDNVKAALHFERLADFFPNSKYRPEALHKAGLLLERMKDYAGALSRFMEASKAYGETAEGAEARFKAADEYFFLGEYNSAIDLLEPLSYATYIPGVRHAEADTKRAVCLFNAGRLDESEKVLRKTLKAIQDELRDDTRDGYLPSQAQFYLAEIFRQHFLDVKLDPTNRTQAELLQDLEYKAQMLLSAQGHYLRCIRVGHGEWATASGYRIGELYQALYESMVDAKPPSDLDADQVDVYREELKNRIRVLVTKAIDAYEQTLATAERVHATNPFVQETRSQLEKMKGLMVKEQETATGSKTPPATTKAKTPDQS
jgi:tetratricopeptide (TPR) repeat protein